MPARSRKIAANPKSRAHHSRAHRRSATGRVESPLGLIAIILLFCAPIAGNSFAAEQHVPVNLVAGNTYVLKNLDPAATPAVRFTGGRQPFMVQCTAPGQCYVLGAEAGQGSVKAELTDHTTAIYDITVTAVSVPGNPLAPGTAPPPIGNGSAAVSGSAPSSSLASSSAPGVSTGYEPEPAPSASQSSGPITRYTQNPQARELEVPPPPGERKTPSETIHVMAGSSKVVDFPLPLRRVSIADSKTADVEVTGPSQLMLVGHQAGFTSLITWDDSGSYHERKVRVDAAGPGEVQLNVVVAELNRTKLEEQGVDVAVALEKTGLSFVSLPGMVATPYNPTINLAAQGGAGTIVALPPAGVVPTGGQLIPLLLSPSLTYGVATQNGNVATTSFIQLLETHDMAKILSAPRLIAESGQEAKFLSGGEIPIVIAQALNTSIVFKQFGTSVNFVPTIVDEEHGEIDLAVRPEFSQPDYSQGVQLFGFTVPAFITRRADTSVRLKENQTFIIAGLLLDTDRSQLQKVPYLGDIPYLGALFRHTYWQHIKSELVMTVTPEIIRPIPSGAKVALPIERGPMTREETRTRPLPEPDVTRPRLPLLGDP